jgi:uroporphyrinogen decarboxylase
MTSRDRVLRAIHHQSPDHVPSHIMGIDSLEPWLKFLGAKDYFDVREKLGVDLQEARPVFTSDLARHGLDIWGVPLTVGGSEGTGYSSVRGRYSLGNAETISEIEKFPWPNPDDFDYTVVANVLRGLPEEKAKCVKIQFAVAQAGASHEMASRGGGQWVPLLCSLFNIFGLEETLVNLALKPQLIQAAVAKIEHFTLEFTRRLLEATKGCAEICWYGDDFACQRGLMFSPAQWRTFLKPTYAKVFELIKSHGLKVWFHSCGTFRPVLPDLIDIGMDIWETVQVHLPGNEPEVLKREFGHCLTFYGAINSQQTLPFGTPDQIRQEVRDRVRVLGQNGGYICGPDHSILPDVPIINVLAMIEEAKRCV